MTLGEVGIPAGTGSAAVQAGCAPVTRSPAQGFCLRLRHSCLWVPDQSGGAGVPGHPLLEKEHLSLP